MATDNNINNFTAVDIEKYHKGLLSSKEMHDMEKAALDDPFLADALEGYAVPHVNAGADIAELKKRLGERTEEIKVVSLYTERKNNFRLLRVAAMFLFIAGAAFLVYQLGFNKNDKEIAQNKPAIEQENIFADSAGAKINTPATESVAADEATEIVNNEKNEIASKPIDNKKKVINKDVQTVTSENAVVATPANVIPPAPPGKNEGDAIISKVIEKKTASKEEVTTKNENVALANERMAERKVVATGSRSDDLNLKNQTTNIFRGRVTDENNVGVPFANVTNLEENTGTYTDVRGYFNLTYPDTLLSVQVRSIGFENNNVQLRNTAPTNQVVLQDDRNSLSESVISNQKPNLQARSNNNTMQLEEPEPKDGWGYYDNYLVNNLQLPDDYKAKPTYESDVKVSFEVNKNGEPVNFKIEKSLCSKCDKEAIRLIKEGPKWKQKAKNRRTTVSIPF